MLQRTSVREKLHSSNSAAGTRLSHEDLIRLLTQEDRDAIEQLAQDSPRRTISSQQAFRLLELGLAELICGHLILTREGITARAVLRDL